MRQPPRLCLAASAGEQASALAKELLRPGLSRPLRIALSGGQTPAAVLPELVRLSETDPSLRELLQTAVFYQVDERNVPADHPRSNQAMLRRSFFAPLQTPESRLRFLQGDAPDLRAEAQRYNEQLLQEGGAPDIALLGLGDDGHTASLFPGSPGLRENEKYCIDNIIPNTGEHRLTMTFPCLMSVKRLVFIVTGTGKNAIVKEVIGNRADFPASLLLMQHPDGSVILDPEAAQEVL